MLTEPPPVCLRIVFNSTLTAFTDDPIVAWRLIRFKFPQTKYERDGHDMIKQNDREAKLKMKRYADASHRSKPSNLQLDDRVLLRNKRENKLTPAFDPQPYTVVGRKGSMISAKRG